MAKSMDFPGPNKKTKYSEAIQSTQNLDKEYIAVPGMSGERGEKGNIGAKVDIRYDFSITPESNNTEFWLRTFTREKDNYPISYLGQFKYKYQYDVSFLQTLFIDSQSIKTSGGSPQVRADNESTISIKGIYISVS